MIDKNSLPVGSPQVYTDLAGVRNLKASTHGDKNAQLREMAHQFESLMVQMMMKSMRQANEVFSDGDPLSSSESKFYQDMFDNQLSLTLSQGRGMGIASALLRQLQEKYGEPETQPGAAKPDHTLPPRPVAASVSASASALRPPVQRDPVEVQEAMRRLFSGEDEPDENAADGGVAAAGALDGSPAAFIEALQPQAERVAKSLGVDSRVLLSQAALETGWGQKVLQRADGTSSFNFFNIKADANWRGAVVTVPTIEYRNGIAVRETATFRAYSSPQQSFSDYAKLIAENPRYQHALQRAADPRAYVHALARAGYATDPRYADKVLAVLDSDQVRQAVVDGEIADHAAVDHEIKGPR